MRLRGALQVDPVAWKRWSDQADRWLAEAGRKIDPGSLEAYVLRNHLIHFQMTNDLFIQSPVQGRSGASLARIAMTDFSTVGAMMLELLGSKGKDDE